MVRSPPLPPGSAVIPLTRRSSGYAAVRSPLPPPAIAGWFAVRSLHTHFTVLFRTVRTRCNRHRAFRPLPYHRTHYAYGYWVLFYRLCVLGSGSQFPFPTPLRFCTTGSAVLHGSAFTVLHTYYRFRHTYAGSLPRCTTVRTYRVWFSHVTLHTFSPFLLRLPRSHCGCSYAHLTVTTPHTLVRATPAFTACVGYTHAAHAAAFCVLTTGSRLPPHCWFPYCVTPSRLVGLCRIQFCYYRAVHGLPCGYAARFVAFG